MSSNQKGSKAPVHANDVAKGLLTQWVEMFPPWAPMINLIVLVGLLFAVLAGGIVVTNDASIACRPLVVDVRPDAEQTLGRASIVSAVLLSFSFLMLLAVCLYQLVVLEGEKGLRWLVLAAGNAGSFGLITVVLWVTIGRSALGICGSAAPTELTIVFITFFTMFLGAFTLSARSRNWSAFNAPEVSSALAHYRSLLACGSLLLVTGMGNVFLYVKRHPSPSWLDPFGNAILVGLLLSFAIAAVFVPVGMLLYRRMETLFFDQKTGGVGTKRSEWLEKQGLHENPFAQIGSVLFIAAPAISPWIAKWLGAVTI